MSDRSEREPCGAPEPEAPGRQLARPRPARPRPARPRLVPADERERVAAVDTLRGVAVLGILAMNISAFAMPQMAYTNPNLHGDAGVLALGVWALRHLLFEQKLITLFALLFGASLVLMTRRARARGAPLRGLYYRRLLWLAVFGLAHMLLVWDGDVLFFYAVCGLILYPLRARTPRFLMALGAVLLLVTPLLGASRGLLGQQMAHTATRAEASLAAGAPLTERQERVRAAWRQQEQDRERRLARSREEVVTMGQGSYARILAARAVQAARLQPLLIVTGIWQVGGLMLIGMGLMKHGVLAAACSERVYRRCLTLGYGLGLPLAAVSAHLHVAHGFSGTALDLGARQVHHVASLLVAAGHLGAVMLLCRRGALAGLRARLSAVGRMALSGYLMHSVVFTTVFYGYGLGLFGRVGPLAQLGLVLAMWLAQLGLAPLWLRAFHHGPAEWLWRSLAYGRRQPMRRREPAAAGWS